MAVTQVIVHLTDEESTLLHTLAARRKLSPEQLAAYAVRREIAKAREPDGRDSERRERRLQQRAINLLALTRYLDTHPVPQGQLEKRALAAQLGVAERTLYKYLRYVAEANRLEQQLTPTIG